MPDADKTSIFLIIHKHPQVLYQIRSEILILGGHWVYNSDMPKKGRILSNGLPDPTRPLPTNYVAKITGTGPGRERLYPRGTAQQSLDVKQSIDKAREEGTLGVIGIGGPVEKD
jgi:hypothetical protein